MSNIGIAANLFQPEEFNKKHMMKIVDMYTRRGYDITK